MGTSTKEYNAPNAPAIPTYAQAMEVRGIDRLLFISGQIPANVKFEVPTTFYDQSNLAWANVIAQLEAADMTMDNLVKVTVFLSDRKYTDDYRRSRDEVLGDHRIGLTTIVCDIFDDAWLLEIEAIAAA